MNDSEQQPRLPDGPVVIYHNGTRKEVQHEDLGLWYGRFDLIEITLMDSRLREFMTAPKPP